MIMSEDKAYSITGVSPKHVVNVFEAQCEDFFDGNVKTTCIFTTEANDDSWCVTFYRRYDGRKRRTVCWLKCRLVKDTANGSTRCAWQNVSLMRCGLTTCWFLI